MSLPIREIRLFTEMKNIISKVYAKVIPIRVPKGTIFYDVGSSPL